MRKIKWGVLGTAGIARKSTIPGMQLAQNCELYAIAGRSLEKAEQFKADFGFEKAYGSYDELLADPNVEAVYIPLPNNLHAEWSIRAMKAGKHVLCEKPLVADEEEIREIYRTAKENNVHFMEAFAYLHSPFVQALKDEVNSGTVGKITYIHSTFISGVHTTENIRMRKENAGGALYDLGCYDTSLILQLLGEQPVEIHAAAEMTEDNIDRHMFAIMRFPCGARASMECGMILDRQAICRQERLEIHGSKGIITSNVQFNQDGELSYLITLADGTKQEKTLHARQNYTLEVEQLGRCITDGETPFVTEEFSLENAKLIGRILEEIGY